MAGKILEPQIHIDQTSQVLEVSQAFQPQDTTIGIHQ